MSITHSRIKFIGVATLALFAACFAAPSLAAEPAIEGVSAPLHALPDPGAAYSEAFASGAVTAQTVFPPDDRIAITDTAKAPWRSVALLLIYDRPGHIEGSCTGSMLSSNVVLTAAHCLYQDQFAYSIVVAPGATPASPPFGVASGGHMVIPVTYHDTKAGAADYGLIILDGAPFSDLTAPYLTIAAASDSYFSDPALVIATAGFPGDKPTASMWFTAGFGFFVDPTYIFTTMDAAAGQSGSPIYSVNVTRNEVYQVGIFTAESPLANLAIRFTPPVVATLKSFCAKATPACTFDSTTVTAVERPNTGPTRYHGTVTGMPSGAVVIALVTDGAVTTVCGIGTTSNDSGNIVYSVTVAGIDQSPACGRAGRTVELYFPSGAQGPRVSSPTPWDSPGPVQFDPVFAAALTNHSLGESTARDGSY